MIGIIGAMDEEVQQIVAEMDVKKVEEKASMTFKMGILEGKKILVTGVTMNPSIAYKVAEIAAAEGATVVVSKWEKALDYDKLDAALAGKAVSDDTVPRAHA